MKDFGELIGLVRELGPGGILIVFGLYTLFKAKVKGDPVSTIITKNVLAIVLVLTGVFFLVWGLVV